MGTIVVGVDGSPESYAALSWALEEARLRGASLRAVTAWTLPAGVGIDAPAYLLPEVLAAFEDDGRAVLDHALGEVVGTSDPGLAIERVVARGPAARILLESAADADLLVVGSRGRGGFSGLLLGSVSQQCAHHAPCPLVIVHRPAEG